MRVVKVVQYNIWKSRYPRGVADFLTQHQPDVVTLQEVWQGGEASTFDLLQDRLGYQGVYAPAIELDTVGPGVSQGNAILSRFPITDSGIVYLGSEGLGPKSRYSDSRLEPRVCLWARLAIDEISFQVMTTHLTYEAGSEPDEIFGTSLLQLEQAKRVAELLNLSRGLPTIFAGDLNNTPGSKPVSMIRSAMGLGEMTAEEGVPTFPVHSWERRGFRLDPPPQVKIDYVFVAGGFSIRSYRTEPVDHSDHLPIIVELALDNEKEG